MKERMTPERAKQITAGPRPHHTDVAAYHMYRRALIALGLPTHSWRMPAKARRYFRKYRQQNKKKKVA